MKQSTVYNKIFYSKQIKFQNLKTEITMANLEE